MPARTSIIAYVGEDPRYAPVYHRAIEAAKLSGAPVIFYDADAASRFGSPLPTWWSVDGDDDDNVERLRPEHLDAAGRATLANHVREAMEQGVRAFGWLPSSRGAKQLGQYATSQAAELVIVPSDLEHKGLADWVRGSPSVSEVDDAVPADIIVVDVKSGAVRAPQASTAR